MSSPSVASPATASPADAAAAHRAARIGGLAATLCYFMWGMVPLYWKQLASINPVELIAHRHVWSLVFVLALVTAQGGLGEIRAVLGSRRAVALNLISAVLLTGNWLIYVWGVNTGHVIECSLGYFLVPLVNVACGRFLLHEHLRRAQWLAIGLAALGVAWMIVQLGGPPWIALGLAATWGGYSLMRKKSPLGSLTGLTLETLLLAPVAVAFLLWQHHTGAGALGRVDLRLHVLVLSAGVITAIPLLLFAFGARRIRLSTLGLLQYITPTVQFAIGRWVYHEPFSRDRAASFALIWVGLALYTADNLLAQRRAARAAGK
ncbi:MAG TPA: EamA family transporter RarD [Opitutaceae bacterium]|nr:EamA family transporter RarD [Opitutaceae bacterium]